MTREPSRIDKRHRLTREYEGAMVHVLTRQQASAVTATSLVTTAGGAMDVWVYLTHGHVFATAQTGNVALMTMAIARLDLSQAIGHATSLAAFVAGAFISRQAGSLLKRVGWNSRDIRLAVECLLLTGLGLAAKGLPNQAVIACIGFIAGIQITSLSHIGPWSFNTGMTTGNLRGAVTAFSNALSGSRDDWAHALMMAALCAAFTLGALAGAWLTPRLGDLTLLPIAACVAASIPAAPWTLDPIPGWKELR